MNVKLEEYKAKIQLYRTMGVIIAIIACSTLFLILWGIFGFIAQSFHIGDWKWYIRAPFAILMILGVLKIILAMYRTYMENTIIERLYIRLNKRLKS